VVHKVTVKDILLWMHLITWTPMHITDHVAFPDSLLTCFLARLSEYRVLPNRRAVRVSIYVCIIGVNGNLPVISPIYIFQGKKSLILNL